MNRSILIIICDFLLVSLIAFSDFNKSPGENREEAAKVEATPSTPGSGTKEGAISPL